MACSPSIPALPVVTPAPPIPAFEAEGVLCHAMPAGRTPGRIVVTRLHAFGDVVIALPIVAALRRRYPSVRLEVVTSRGYEDLFTATGLADRVWTLATTGSRPSRFLSALALGSRIGRSALFIDLQRSTQSLLLRRMIRPDAWVAFDRFAPRPALERYREAVEMVTGERLLPDYRIPVVSELRARARTLLGVDTASPRPLFCLNPAGCWETKRWPIENYCALGRRLVDEMGARIVLLGTANVESGARRIREALGKDAIDLVGRTSSAEALAIVQELSLMVSDDSGLMHLAWTSGVPTVAPFGATRSIWSAPQGSHSHCFASEDLGCGACMQPICARADLLCLNRVSVEDVWRKIEDVGCRTW